MSGVRYGEFRDFVQEHIVSDRTARIKAQSTEGFARIEEKFPTKGNLLAALSGRVSTEINIADEDENE